MEFKEIIDKSKEIRRLYHNIPEDQRLIGCPFYGSLPSVTTRSKRYKFTTPVLPRKVGE